MRAFGSRRGRGKRLLCQDLGAVSEVGENSSQELERERNLDYAGL